MSRVKSELLAIIGVIRLLVLQNPKNDMDELAHGCNNDCHFRKSSISQALTEFFNIRVVWIGSIFHLLRKYSFA